MMAVLLLLPLAACQGERAEEMTAEARMTVMVMPVTTASEEAKGHFMQGQHALDMGRTFDAVPQFNAALEADPNFAYAYLQLANASNSLDEFMRYLEMAAQRAEGASEAERLQIQIAQTFLNNDVEGRMQLAERLCEVAPESPRAWLTLAGNQTGLNRNAEARATMMKAVEASPEFAPAYMQLGNSYLYLEPKDFSKAEANFARVAELEPNEAISYDLLGDVYRAQNKLTPARDSYTRAVELAPEEALPLQQRGHVNSFLGAYDDARADYDAAMALGKGNQPANFGQYRAYVSVYEGNPQAAIDELNTLAVAVDGMGIPEPRGAKIAILTDVATIALHHNMIPAAETALMQRSQLMLEQADQVGTEEFRRGQVSNNVYFEGLLAARAGDYATATAKADEFMSIVEPSNDPRKNEPAHDLLGLVSLLQGDYAGAIGHYKSADPNNVYNLYHHALALEGAGDTAAAMEIYKALAVNNFNFVGYALIRKDVVEKTM
jgi:tetratricopeptide (TPR) repeat protein